jgi:hypothetical protein
MRTRNHTETSQRLLLAVLIALPLLGIVALASGAYGRGLDGSASLLFGIALVATAFALPVLKWSTLPAGLVLPLLAACYFVIGYLVRRVPGAFAICLMIACIFLATGWWAPRLHARKQPNKDESP